MSNHAYIRIKEMRHIDDKDSIEVQEQHIAEYCASRKLLINSWYRERGISGTVNFEIRPRAKTLLANLKAGDCIIAASFDRLFRSPSDALQTINHFEKVGVNLHIVDLDGDISKILSEPVKAILSSFVERSNVQVGKRIADAKQAMRDEGKYQGGKIPFGYRVDHQGKIQEDELQQKCIKVIKQKNEEGLSLRQISDFLKSDMKVKLSYQGVRNVLLGLRRTDDGYKD